MPMVLAWLELQAQVPGHCRICWTVTETRTEFSAEMNVSACHVQFPAPNPESLFLDRDFVASR